MVSNQDMKEFIFDKLQVKSIYIARAPYTVKGVAMYIIFFNSRLPGSNISVTSITNQSIFKSFLVLNGGIHDLRLEEPLPLREYSKTIRPNSIFTFIDLAGDFLAKDYSL